MELLSETALPLSRFSSPRMADVDGIQWMLLKGQLYIRTGSETYEYGIALPLFIVPWLRTIMHQNCGIINLLLPSGKTFSVHSTKRDIWYGVTARSYYMTVSGLQELESWLQGVCKECAAGKPSDVPTSSYTRDLLDYLEHGTSV
jgi:hypothetical protein